MEYPLQPRVKKPAHDLEKLELPRKERHASSPGGGGQGGCCGVRRTRHLQVSDIISIFLWDTYHRSIIPLGRRRHLNGRGSKSALASAMCQISQERSGSSTKSLTGRCAGNQEKRRVLHSDHTSSTYSIPQNKSISPILSGNISTFVLKIRVCTFLLPCGVMKNRDSIVV